VGNAQAGWYDDAEGNKRWWDGEKWTDQVQPQPDVMGGQIEGDAGGGALSGSSASRASYVVLQVILKEKLWGTGSGNLPELERTINTQAAHGYRLHTITTASSGSKGLGGGDRIQATMIFERLT
jgi:hypothetical protein